MKPRTRTLLYTAVRGLWHYPWQITVGAAMLAGVAALFASARWEQPSLIIGGVATAAFVACQVWWVVRHIMPPGSSAGWSARRSEWAQRSKGFASRLDIAEHASVAAMRSRARTLRPGLADVRVRKIKPTELGVLIGRLGLGLFGERLWSSCESTTLRIGGPRSGKTQSLIPHGLDAPGALITTSTRLDIAEGVQAARASRAVWVFNPLGLGGVPSNVVWSAVAGCDDFETATRRAAALIPSNGAGSDHHHWTEQARNLLAILLHAAALDGRDMSTVARWAASDSTETRDEIVDILHSEELGGEQRAQTVLGHWATNDRTRTSVTHSMKPAFAWLNDRRARELGDAPPGADLFDPRLMILGGETLHLLGHSQEGSPLAPLIACLVGEITYETRQLADGRRIDPPVTMLLDEVALVCPIPLDDWMADFGGAGITVHVSVQGVDQLEKRWGKYGAGTILTTANCLIVFGGSNNEAEIQAISTLTGEHMRRVLKADDKGDFRTDQRWTAVRSAAEIRAMPPGTALILRQALLPVIATAPAAYDRKGWRPVPLSRGPISDFHRRRGLPHRRPALSSRDLIIPAQDGTTDYADDRTSWKDANDG